MRINKPQLVAEVFISHLCVTVEILYINPYILL